MKLKLKKEFNKVYLELLEKDYSVWIISQLIELIRLNKHELEIEEVQMLLEIPLTMWEEDVKFKGQPVSISGSYLAGKIPNPNKKKQLTRLREKMEQECYTEEDIISIIQYCYDHIQIDDWGNLEDMLRIPEALMKSGECDIKDMEQFRKHGNVYASIIKKVCAL